LQLATFNLQPSTCNLQPSTCKLQPSTLPAFAEKPAAGKRSLNKRIKPVERHFERRMKLPVRIIVADLEANSALPSPPHLIEALGDVTGSHEAARAALK
jgi:hypothetical protein